MSSKDYSFKKSYASNTSSFGNTKVMRYYFIAFFEKIFYFILIIVSIFMMNLSISNNRTINNFKENILFISKPIFVISESPFNILFNIIKTAKDIILTNINNKKLTEQNIILRKLYKESMDIKAENENLKKLLNFKNNTKNNYNYITSRIYAVSKNGMNNLLSLNIGQNDGVNEGDLVLGVNRSVAGRVVNVSDKYSTILLLNDINSKIPARTAKTKERIILSGNNSGNLVISYFNSKEPQILEGDYVFTSGDSNIIPDGFLIGTIKKIDNEFIIEMNENVNTLFNVMIISPKSK